MRIKNFSIYPTAEIGRLIRFACEGIAISNVLFQIRTTPSRAYGGRIWYRTPLRRGRNGLWAKRERIRILIRVGPQSKFPVNNMCTARRWVDTIQTPQQLVAQGREYRSFMRCQNGVQTWSHQVLVETPHPYGGKSSPLITYTSWQEAVVAVAAHEGKHLVQFRNRIPRSEVDCEAYALRKLTEFRSIPLAQAAHS